jgi:hypothetical protein
MKLKDLLLNHTWLDVKHKLLELYPDQLQNIIGYEELFANLVEMKEVTINMTIKINKYIDDDLQKDAVDLIGYYNERGLQIFILNNFVKTLAFL